MSICIEMNKIYEYKGYKTSFQYSIEDNIYYGSLLDIRDSVSFHGDTLEEVYQGFKDMVDDYIEFKEELRMKGVIKESG